MCGQCAPSSPVPPPNGNPRPRSLAARLPGSQVIDNQTGQAFLVDRVDVVHGQVRVALRRLDGSPVVGPRRPLRGFTLAR